MVTKELQTLNLKFDQVMFNSLVLTWERNFEVTFDNFSVLILQISVLESYLYIWRFGVMEENLRVGRIPDRVKPFGTAKLYT